MKPLEIYKKYPVPRLLQKHHIRVASVGAYIASHFKNPGKIDKILVIKTLLLHDIGNIVKFNLDKPEYMSRTEWKNINVWRKKQDLYRKKYESEHTATLEMVKSLGIDKVPNHLKHVGVSRLPQVVKSQDYNLKLITYADLRCAPFSIVSINQRFDDIATRYKNTKHSLSKVNQMAKRRNMALLLEKQLQEVVNIELTDITESDFESYKRKVKSVEI